MTVMAWTSEHAAVWKACVDERAAWTGERAEVAASSDHAAVATWAGEHT